jgi:hypothetical protein
MWNKGRVNTTWGPEFGNEMKGRIAIICPAVYGLKSSGATWHSLFSKHTAIHGAGPDIWLAWGYKRKRTTIVDGKPTQGSPNINKFFNMLMIYLLFWKHLRRS